MAQTEAQNAEPSPEDRIQRAKAVVYLKGLLENPIAIGEAEGNIPEDKYIKDVAARADKFLSSPDVSNNTDRALASKFFRDRVKLFSALTHGEIETTNQHREQVLEDIKDLSRSVRERSKNIDIKPALMISAGYDIHDKIRKQTASQTHSSATRQPLGQQTTEAHMDPQVRLTKDEATNVVRSLEEGSNQAKKFIAIARGVNSRGIDFQELEAAFESLKGEERISAEKLLSAWKLQKQKRKLQTEKLEAVSPQTNIPIAEADELTGEAQIDAVRRFRRTSQGT